MVQVVLHHFDITVGIRLCHFDHMVSITELVLLWLTYALGKFVAGAMFCTRTQFLRRRRIIDENDGAENPKGFKSCLNLWVCKEPRGLISTLWKESDNTMQTVQCKGSIISNYL